MNKPVGETIYLLAAHHAAATNAYPGLIDGMDDFDAWYTPVSVSDRTEVIFDILEILVGNDRCIDPRLSTYQDSMFLTWTYQPEDADPYYVKVGFGGV